MFIICMHEIKMPTSNFNNSTKRCYLVSPTGAIRTGKNKYCKSFYFLYAYDMMIFSYFVSYDV